jgi:maleate isomerase
MDARRVCLLTPYPIEFGRHEELELIGRGIEIVCAAHLNIQKAYCTITSEELTVALDRWRKTAIDVADAVVLSCTAWPTLRAIQILEAQLLKPVISSNLAIAVSALIQCGRIAASRAPDLKLSSNR